jgi:hypothetical protein
MLFLYSVDVGLKVISSATATIYLHVGTMDAVVNHWLGQTNVRDEGMFLLEYCFSFQQTWDFWLHIRHDTKTLI